MRIYSASGLLKGAARGLQGFPGMPGMPADPPEEPEMGPPGPRGPAGAAGSSVAGSDTQVQFNDGGSFGADAQYTYDKTTNTLVVAGTTFAPGQWTFGAVMVFDIFPTLGGTNQVTWDDYFYRFEGFALTMALTSGSDGASSGFILKDELDAARGFFLITSSVTTTNPFFPNVPSGQSVQLITNVNVPCYFGSNAEKAAFGFDADGNFIQPDKDIQVPTNGFTITIASHSTILNPAGTLATGTIEMPAAPTDSQVCRFSSTEEVTALTVSGNGNTILAAPTTILAGEAFEFIFNAGDTTWYPH